MKNENVKHKTASSYRGRTPEGEPNPIDVHVGNRVRLRRTLLGMSQEKLGSLLGLTFQQVQKYERGINRIGASRLWDLSNVLGVPVSFFFEDMEKNVAKQSPRLILTNEGMNRLELAEESAKFDNDPMNRRETLELVRAYYRITDIKVAKKVMELILSLANSYGSLNE